LGCGNHLFEKDELICFVCERNLPYTNENVFQNSLTPKLQALSNIDGVYAMCYYNPGGLLQELLKELKYKKQHQLGAHLGRLLGLQLKEQQLQHIDEIVPVPLHPQKMRKRGYNQARKIAEGVGQVLNLPVNDRLVLRTVNTKTQTKRTKLNRFENVENIFSLQDDDEIGGKRFLVVDDVITTGATILSCADQLIHHGAESVVLASIAKADVLG